MLWEEWGVRAMAKTSKKAAAETQTMGVQRRNHWREQKEVVSLRIKNQDGGVEGRALTPSYKNTRITTNC